ncbi:MAG: hypothetical protein IJG83_00385 [Thermoguttaceae bacterium]|nr:hypothetical protein [Thermoguttaceae bacterium]
MSKITVDFDKIKRDYPRQERGLAVARSVFDQCAPESIKSIFERFPNDGQSAGEELEELGAFLVECGTKILDSYAKEHPKLCAAGKRWLTERLLHAWVFELLEEKKHSQSAGPSGDENRDPPRE